MIFLHRARSIQPFARASPDFDASFARAAQHLGRHSMDGSAAAAAAIAKGSRRRDGRSGGGGSDSDGGRTRWQPPAGGALSAAAAAAPSPGPAAAGQPAGDGRGHVRALEAEGWLLRVPFVTLFEYLKVGDDVSHP